jgi:hypothetical protein
MWFVRIALTRPEPAGGRRNRTTNPSVSVLLLRNSPTEVFGQRVCQLDRNAITVK